MKQKQAHIEWIDIARVFAILCVLLNHAVDETYVWKLEVMNGYNVVSQLFAYTAFFIGRIGVPAFLMISGYLLLDREWTKERCSKFWRCNWLKLFICTEIWWVIYEIYLNVYYKVPFDAVEIFKYLTFLKMVPLPHVWYMTKILGIYILIPFVGVALQHFGTKTLKFPLIIFGLYTFLCPIFDAILTILGKENLSVQFSQGYSGGEFGLYVIMGYLIKKGCFDRIKSIWLFLCATVSLALTTALQMWALNRDVSYNIWYDNGCLLLCSVSVMILISRLDNLPQFVMKMIRSISKYSFGIYLVHELILQPMRSVIRNADFPVVTCTLLRYVFTIIASWGCVALISRIPKIGKFLFNQK